MDRRKTFFRSFKARVTFCLIAAMIFTATLCNLFLYKYALDSQFEQLRKKLMIIAQTAALAVDGDQLARVPLNREGANSAPYKAVLKTLKKIKQVDPTLKYVYTMAKTATPGTWQFIVDADAVSVDAEGAVLTSYPGEAYDAFRFPEMMKAFDGPAADRHLVVDEWGALLSGYAPVLDSSGAAVAMIGVDIQANDVRALQRGFHLRAFLALALAILIALLVGPALASKITRRIKELAEGALRIREGDFRHQVRVGGRDEIGQLARNFNIMAKSLWLSNKKMHKYFYRAMESLVRILEAKDRYTMGHSDRVGEYAEKIAVKMGLSAEEVELIRDASRLHDIGKLAIDQDILNKQGKLTDEEWEKIKQHPVIGMDILKPVIFDKQMLAIVRWHHERYDGKGYPDQKKGEDLNVLTRIVAVADAYDAMTSDRAYRKGLKRDIALREIEKGKGSQFDPVIADVFIQLMRDE